MSNKINTFKKAISNYIEIDKEINRIESKNEDYINRLKEKIKELENPVKELKNKKNTLNDFIIKTMEDNNMKNKSFKLKVDNFNYTIKCEKSEKKDTLTQKFIKESLINYHKKKNNGKLSDTACEEKALEVFQYLLDSRNIKETTTLIYDK